MTPAKHPRLQTVKRRSRNVSQAPKLSSSDILWYLETEQPASGRYFTWMKNNNFWILILYILSEGALWMTTSKVVNEAIKLQHWYLEVAWHQNPGQTITVQLVILVTSFPSQVTDVLVLSVLISLRLRYFKSHTPGNKTWKSKMS